VISARSNPLHVVTEANFGDSGNPWYVVERASFVFMNSIYTTYNTKRMVSCMPFMFPLVKSDYYIYLRHTDELVSEVCMTEVCMTLMPVH